MWWFDKFAVKQALKLRDRFHISTYIETGIFRGLNIKFHSYNFLKVWGCEIKEEYFRIAEKRVKNLKNVEIYKQSSPAFLELFLKRYREEGRRDIVLIYLDAHFYDPTASLKDRWVVLKELKALKSFKNCIICIHDFDCERLGHLSYGGKNLDFSLLRKDLSGVNSDFFFYTNSRKFSEAHTKETAKGFRGLDLDADTLETIEYHNNDRLKYRGILYCVPEMLDLKKFELVKMKNNSKRR